MQKIFDEVGTLDKKCYEEFGLSEDLLMENAALGLKSALKKFKKGSSVLIVSGPGNNGGDGITLSRMIKNDFKVSLHLPFGARSKMAKLQLERAKKVGVKICEKISKADIVVDALFGSGLTKPLDQETTKLINKLNTLEAYKIACDIPTGINTQGNIETEAFKANITVTMGALKKSLFSDNAKEYVGKIKVADLGVARSLYENESEAFLLEKEDMKLPIREKENVNKGDFGRLSVLCGDKKGAAVIASSSAMRFGAGLVTMMSKKERNIPPEIMQSKTLPKNTTTVCAGMGLGDEFDDEELRDILMDKKTPLVCDADLFYKDIVFDILNSKDKLVLTPHPKEFSSLLKITGLSNISPSQVQKDRFELAKEFSLNFPNSVLLLKGANTIIAQNGTIYVSGHGTNALSKGGSGDVLGGMIGALLAQGYSPLEAAVSGSLAHSFCAKNFKGSNYSLTPEDLIRNIGTL